MHTDACVDGQVTGKRLYAYIYMHYMTALQVTGKRLVRVTEDVLKRKLGVDVLGVCLRVGG